MPSKLCRLLALVLISGTAHAQSYYKEPPLFSKRPDEKKSSFLLERFGPVGMSLELIQPAFTMRIKAIEPGSPASQTNLKAGQII